MSVVERLVRAEDDSRWSAGIVEGTSIMAPSAVVMRRCRQIAGADSADVPAALAGGLPLYHNDPRRTWAIAFEM